MYLSFYRRSYLLNWRFEHVPNVASRRRCGAADLAGARPAISGARHPVLHAITRPDPTKKWAKRKNSCASVVRLMIILSETPHSSCFSFVMCLKPSIFLMLNGIVADSTWVVSIVAIGFMATALV